MVSQVDFRAKLWTCPFCGQRNHFPPEYAQNISFLLDAKLFILTCLRLFGAGKGR